MNDITRNYLRVVLRWWQIYVGVALIFVIASSAYLLLKPPSYSSTAVFFVSTPRDDALSLYSGDVYSKGRLASFAAIGSSPLIAERVIETVGLSTDPVSLVAATTVVPIDGTVLLSLTTSGNSPNQAQDIAQAYVNEMTRTVDELETRPGALSPRSELVTVQTPTLGVADGRFPPVLIIGAAGCLGLILAGFLVALRALVDGRIRLPEDGAEAAQAPVMGEFTTPTELTSALTDPASVESARNVRPHLDRVHLQGGKVIQVTSADDVPAKTGVALSLASALAERGSSVALVDLDGRHSQLASEIPELRAATTLRDLLAQGTGAVQGDAQIQGVVIVPFGESELSPGAAIDDPAIKVVFSDLRFRFDWIIVDTPAITKYSDAMRATKLVDAAILVAQMDHTRFDELRTATEELVRSGGQVMGICLVKERGTGRSRSVELSRSHGHRQEAVALSQDRGSA
jgi:polysaccharide biosynthesis transport protein